MPHTVICAYVADKICFGRTNKFGIGIGIWFSAVQWRWFPHWASVVPVTFHSCNFSCQKLHSRIFCEIATFSSKTFLIWHFFSFNLKNVKNYWFLYDFKLSKNQANPDVVSTDSNSLAKILNLILNTL